MLNAKRCPPNLWILILPLTTKQKINKIELQDDWMLMEMGEFGPIAVEEWDIIIC